MDGSNHKAHQSDPKVSVAERLVCKLRLVFCTTNERRV